MKSLKMASGRARSSTCSGSIHLAVSRSSHWASVRPSMTSLVVSSSAILASLFAFLRLFSSSSSACARTRPCSKSFSGCFPIAFTAFLSSAATNEPSSLTAAEDPLSSSSKLSRISSTSCDISPRRESREAIFLTSSASRCSCTSANGRIRPAQPSCTSTSLPFFFLTTIFGSTLRTAPFPSVWMTSRSPEIPTQASSSAW